MKKRTGIWVFVICYLSYTLLYIARLNLSIASPDFIRDGILTKSQIGFMGSVFFDLYAVGRLINGAIGDRVKPCYMIAVGLLFVAVSNIVIGLLPPYACMLVFWGVNAFAQSMLWSSILKIVSSLYEESKAKKLTPYMVTSVAAGNVLGIVLNTWFIRRFSARYAFLIPGLSAVLFCVLILVFTRKIVEKGESRPTKSLLSVLKNKDVQFCLLPAMFHGVMKDNISLWMAVYIVEEFGMDLNRTSYFILLIPIIGFVGRMLYPALYRACGFREHSVSKIGFVICVVCSVLLSIGLPSAVLSVIALSLIYAAVSLINSTFLSVFPMQFSESGNVSSVSGIMDFATYLGAGISSAVFGYVVEKAGYPPMFASWAVLSAVSLIVLGTVWKARKPS